MKGVRVTRKKAVVSLPALAMFLQEFRASRLIQALIEITEFAADSPEFGLHGRPNEHDYLYADEATDHLSMLFLDPDCVEEFPVNDLWYVVDAGRQELTIYFEDPKPRPSSYPEKPLSPPPEPIRDANATTSLPIRLLRNGDSLN